MLSQNSLLKKAWKSSEKKFENATKDRKKEIQSYRSWIYRATLKFINFCLTTDDTKFTEAYLEFLVVLLSQVPTRRYTNALLHDLNIPAIVSFSHGRQQSPSPLNHIFNYYAFYPINDFTGEPLNAQGTWNLHFEKVKTLQRVSYSEKYKQKLGLLALANFDSIQNRADLEDHLYELSTDELLGLAEDVEIRTSYDNDKTDVTKKYRNLLIEFFVQKYLLRDSLESVTSELSLYPTDETLYTRQIQQMLDYADYKLPLNTPLATHKLGQQYLTIQDFWVRSFLVKRAEHFSYTRRFVERVVSALKPQTVSVQKRRGDDAEDNEDVSVIKDVKLSGNSKHALKVLNNPVVLQVSDPFVGEVHPRAVLVEVDVDLGKFPKKVRKEWETLQSNDLMYLVELQTPSSDGNIGINRLRAAQVVNVLDTNSNPINGKKRTRRDIEGGSDDEDDDDDDNGKKHNKIKRKIHLHIDPVTYGLVDHENVLINHLNVIIKAPESANIQRSELTKLQHLSTLNPEVNRYLPEWALDAFLGFGGIEEDDDERTEKLKIDYMDTFADVKQLSDVYTAALNVNSNNPPFVVDEGEGNTVSSAGVETISSTQFTSAQIKAIYNSIHHGFSVIEGLSGTGKITTSRQIVKLLYTNFPQERTLIIAPNTNTIDQLSLLLHTTPIDVKHVFRLDKPSQINTLLMESRGKLLREVEQLSSSMNIPGAHGDSCETAEYFYSVYIGPIWDKFVNDIRTLGSEKFVETQFPFKNYFINEDKLLLFDENLSEDEKFQVAKGYYFQIQKMHEDIQFLRPFELLHSDRARTKYLIESSARIAITTAATGTQKFQGKFDNVILLNCDKMTETTALTPLSLNNTPQCIKRIIMVGSDTLPCEQGIEKNILHRFIRLPPQPPTKITHLTDRFRVRPELRTITESAIQSSSSAGDEKYNDHANANAGFLYPVQFINVVENEETEPTRDFIQNLGEAHYTVTLYRYMRLLGYPKEVITIVANTVGQKKLIEEISQVKCDNTSIFGLPNVSTTEEFIKSQPSITPQNDILIMSLVRTNTVIPLEGLMIREIIGAVSYSVMGLYIVGKKRIYENFDLMAKIIGDREDDLMLVTQELYNKTTRKKLTEKKPKNTVQMEGLEHLTAYVEDMTTQRLEYEKKKEGNKNM